MLQLKALSVDLSSLDMVEKVAGRACAVLCKQNQYGYPQHLFNQIHLINFVSMWRVFLEVSQLQYSIRLRYGWKLWSWAHRASRWRCWYYRLARSWAELVAHNTLRLCFFLLKFYLGLPKEYINFLNLYLLYLDNRSKGEVVWTNSRSGGPPKAVLMRAKCR